jgi:outer membrane protein TolC
LPHTVKRQAAPLAASPCAGEAGGALSWTDGRAGARAAALVAAAAMLAAHGCASDGGRRSLDAPTDQAAALYQEDAGAKAVPRSRPEVGRAARGGAENQGPGAGGPVPGQSEGRNATVRSSEPASPRSTSPKSETQVKAPPGSLGPLAPEGAPVPVTLETCLRRALARNLGIQIARFGPRIARTTVREAEAMFDPSWFLNNALSRVRADTGGSFLAGAATLIADQRDFSTGLQGLLPTGGSVSLTQDWTYLESNSQFVAPNPQYATGLGVSLAHPLLRGAGPTVTRSPIVLARLDHTISQAEFRRQVMDILLDAESTYWQLVLAQKRTSAVAESLEAAREHRRIAKARFDEGKATRLIVSLAESAVTERQAALIAARLEQAQTSDRLKRILNDPALALDDPTLLEATESPLAEPLPVDRALVRETMAAALRHRPELQEADARLDQSDLRERVARSDRLPRLDLAAAYGLTGLDRRLGRSLDEQVGAEFYEWTVGVELEVPIGNRARRAAYARSQLERDAAVKQREDARQRVLLEVSEAVRGLAAAQESILATRAAREAAQQTLQDQQANVTAGAALVKDLLDAQRDLADAKVREVEALVTYMTGLAALERAKGTLLEYNHVALAEEGP